METDENSWKNLIEDLQNATENLARLIELADKRQDYSEFERMDFKAKFGIKYENLQIDLSAIRRMSEKFFSITPEECLRRKALDIIHAKFPMYDQWNEAAQKDILEATIKELSKEPNATNNTNNTNNTKRKSKSLLNHSIENPNPNQPYAITNDFTYCKPSMIELFGTQYEVKNWNEVVAIIANILYKKYPASFEKYLKNAPQKAPLITTNPNLYIRHFEFANGMYMNANLSSNDIMRNGALLLTLCGVPLEAVRVYLERVAKK